MSAESKSKMLDIEFYLGAAETHGQDSEPDHEVGDLQDFLRAMWEQLSDSQKAAFAKNPRVHATLDGAMAEFEDELTLLP